MKKLQASQGDDEKKGDKKDEKKNDKKDEKKDDKKDEKKDDAKKEEEDKDIPKVDAPPAEWETAKDKLEKKVEDAITKLEHKNQLLKDKLEEAI